MAAGFTIETKNIVKLKKRMLKIADDRITDDLLTPVLKIDLEIPLSIVNQSLLGEIEELKPFGLGNPQPVFCSKDLSISDVSPMGRDNKHLKFKFYDGSKYYKGVMFNADEEYFDYKLGDKVDIAYSIKRNDFNGRTYIDLFVKDLKSSL